MLQDQLLDTNIPPEKTPRPVFLTVLCILTFVGSGFLTLVFLTTVLAYDALEKVFLQMPGTAYLVSGGLLFFTIMFVFSGLSLVGAILMWQLKRRGFYWYAAANVCGFIYPMIAVNEPMDSLGFLILGIWLMLYGVNVKHLK